MCSHGLDESNYGMLHRRNKTCQKGYFIGENQNSDEISLLFIQFRMVSILNVIPVYKKKGGVSVKSWFRINVITSASLSS
jgi:hypothetical protein